MKSKSIFIIALLSALVFIPVSIQVRAEEKAPTEEEIQDKVDDIQEKINKYEKKISELRGQANTLQNEIEYMDSQMAITELKIRGAMANIVKTKDKIEELSDSIDSLGTRIGKLETSINRQEVVLGSRIRERYKDRGNNVLVVLFGSNTLSSLIKKSEYLQALEENDNKLIKQMGDTRDSFKQQKNIFEDKKTEQEDLKQDLENQKAALDSYKSQLDSQKGAKEKLLADTQNDEQKYQDLLSEAQRQLASFSSFVQYAGGGIIGSDEFGPGKEGWYLSQRDSRWAKKLIGKSNMTIFEVGCLITSVAMLYNHYGYRVTPADIASQSNRFFSNTAMMLIPWVAPPGMSYYSISTSSIDKELEKRPVVVGVYAGPYGTHFVVLSKKSGNDYIMYDPWYGPDLKFSSRYSKSSIYSASVFK